MTIGYNKKRDSLEVFNETWKVGHQTFQNIKNNPVLNHQEKKNLVGINRMANLKNITSNRGNRGNNYGK